MQFAGKEKVRTRRASRIRNADQIPALEWAIGGVGEPVGEEAEVGVEGTLLVAVANTESGVGMAVWLTLGAGIEEYESRNISS